MVYSTTDINNHIITTAAAYVISDRCDHRDPTVPAPGCAASFVGQRQPLGGPQLKEVLAVCWYGVALWLLDCHLMAEGLREGEGNY